MSDAFEDLRPYLTRLAYRMLGSTGDAEDMVQESFVRWREAGSPELDEPRAWFTRVCTRLCVDRLKSAQREREEYPGVWLPEPVVEAARIAVAQQQDTLALGHHGQLVAFRSSSAPSASTRSTCSGMRPSAWVAQLRQGS